ncbi:MAG: winged helix-turn-helix domain-containing protein [Nitrososphaerota archaeon]
MGLEDVMPWLAVAISVSTWLAYWLHSRTIRKTGSDDAVKAILSEVNRRLDNQDKRIIDQQVRLDILELRLERAIGKAQEGPLKTPTLQKFVASQISRKVVEPSDPTHKQIVELLREGPKTSREIEKHIGKSREHTARLLKKLYDEGIVERDVSKRPFKYRLKG